MKKLNIKRQVVSLGLAGMMVLGMGTTSYAEGIYDLGHEDIIGENLTVTPLLPVDWYGTYFVENDGVSYRLGIAPCWDDPDIWAVTATAISYPNGNYHSTEWSGNIFINDPDWNYTAVLSNDGAESMTWGTLADGSFNLAYHMDSETKGLDLSIIGYTGSPSGTRYVDVSTNYGMISNGASSSAFLPALAPAAYKKISNSYELAFSEGSDSSVPSWYWDIASGPDPIILNWEIQSNTPEDQAPITNLPVTLHDWYYSNYGGQSK